MDIKEKFCRNKIYSKIIFKRENIFSLFFMLKMSLYLLIINIKGVMFILNELYNIQIPENWNRKDENDNLIPYENFVHLHCHSYFSL